MAESAAPLGHRPRLSGTVPRSSRHRAHLNRVTLVPAARRTAPAKAIAARECASTLPAATRFSRWPCSNARCRRLSNAAWISVASGTKSPRTRASTAHCSRGAEKQSLGAKASKEHGAFHALSELGPFRLQRVDIALDRFIVVPDTLDLEIFGEEGTFPRRGPSGVECRKGCRRRCT